MSAAGTTRAATRPPEGRTFRSGPYLQDLFEADRKRVDAYLERAVCARIKQARVEAGFTQEDFAGLLNVTVRAVGNYESRRVPWRRLEDIAKLTGVTQEWILRGDLPAVSAPVELLQEVAESVETLMSSQESVQARTGEVLDRLARIEAKLDELSGGRSASGTGHTPNTPRGPDIS